ncbi:Cytochrome p450 [Thalictrum thalictroides]|uniref:Cytochrome p450 n=1 Tax=Thalictrum thalictroides TaxID=46969 RepID=A0A7J6V4I6_THATH|nr:Cytochrome p450 [Thalictrum thalictroides]
MEIIQKWWLAVVFGVLPLLVWLFCSWNELRFITPYRAHSGSNKLPPGSMGLPFVGEMLSIFWYFKIVGQPDEFIESKRRRYGDGVGMYRTHLFGSPAIIGCSPAFNKFVFQSPDLFPPKWPSIELVGYSSLVGVTGKTHTRLRTYVINAINKPDALRKVCKMVQPQIVSSLRSWVDRGKVTALVEIKKVTFENIGNMFVSFKPGPMLDMLDKLFIGLVEGVRSQPSKIPGTAYYRAVQCRKKLIVVFREELEKRKHTSNLVSEERNDLMEGLMKMRDEEGKLLGDEEVLDNIVSLVIAGYESTSLASTMAIYYIAKSPHVLKKLREENMAVARKGKFITSEELALLKYTNKVVDETIRMANISPFVFRHAKDDVNYQGYKIPKDWRIILWIRYLHTDPKNFDDPMNFNPDRWDVPAKPGTYQVFGGGPRICPGNMLAKIQITIFIHHLVTGYKWELINPDAKMMYLPHPKPVDGVQISFSAL